MPSAPAVKRSHDTAFPSSHHGHELVTQVIFAISYLKEKHGIVAFDDLINYLSLPQANAQRTMDLIKRALIDHERVDYFTKAESANGKESFKYRPLHPVTNAEELKTYLARLPTVQGVTVRDLKDGWSGCIEAINELEKAHEILVTRHKKDNMPIRVWSDSPTDSTQVGSDFQDFWSKTKLPTTETERRNELEKAGITPTSQVKEVRRLDIKKKDRKRPNQRNGKFTNMHMVSILKDYGKR